MFFDRRTWMGVPAALALAGAAASTGCGDDAVSHCDESGQACTWAGKAGEFGFTPDGAHRLDTKLYWTMDMLFASDGTVWFIDWNNHLVRRILADDTVTSVVGWTDPVFPGDGLPGGAERSPDGADGKDVQLNHPTDLAETADGKILVMAWHNHKLRQVDPATGKVRIVAGAGAGYAGDGGTALNQILFRQPKGLQLDDAGNTYVLDQQNFRVRKIDAVTGMVTTIAGNGMQGRDGDDMAATAVMLNFEAGSNPEPSGGLVIDGNTLYIADTLSDRIRAVDLTTGLITTIAGTGVAGFSGDGGPARTAQLDKPRDLEIGPEGDLYLADTDNNRIRAIDASGNIRTVAGTGSLGLDDTDDRPALETQLARPFGIEFDPAGALYISDTINSRILKVAR